MVPPNDFIPLAEELGLIERIGDWVVRELACQVAAWRELDIDLEIGFNLSPRQFWQPDLVRRIVSTILDRRARPVARDGRGHRVLRDDGPRPGAGILRELTTRGLAHRDRRLRHRLLVPVAAARTCRVDVLKIDRSFVTHVDTDRRRRRS